MQSLQVAQLYLMQQLIKLFAPSSPAFGNSQSSFFLNPQNEITNLHLEPGDIIFTRTDSAIYNSYRQFLQIDYDHVAVALNSNELLHISPPIVSKIPKKCLIHKCRCPLVVRPNLTEKEREAFLSKLHNTLGTRYSLSAIPKMMYEQIRAKVNLPDKIQYSHENLKNSNICTDAIIYTLCSASERFKQVFEKQVGESRYSELGFFMPDDFLNALQNVYPTIYRAARRLGISDKDSFGKESIASFGLNQMKLIYQKATNLSSVLGIALNLGSLLSPQLRLIKNISSYSSNIYSMLNVFTIMITLCNLMGVKDKKKKKLLVMAMVFMLLSRGIEGSLQELGAQKRNYQVPEFGDVEKLKTLVNKIGAKL